LFPSHDQGGYDTLNAVIKVNPTNVTCESVSGGACGGSGTPRLNVSGWIVTAYLKKSTVSGGLCSWITSIGGRKNIMWANHVLEAYYVYTGVAGHSIGFSPVGWNDVLALYYYYVNNLASAEDKSKCGFS